MPDVSFGGLLVVVLIALGVVVLGCAPNLLIGKLLAAIQSAGFQ